MNRRYFIGLAMIAASATTSPAYAVDQCEMRVQLSAEIDVEITKAIPLMQAKDIAALGAMLPNFKQLLAKIPAAVPEPELCGATVNVYDGHQYLAIDELRKAGNTVPGYAANTVFASQPLSYGTLAYVVGWTEYELGDFAAAKVDYQKGLMIVPNDHDLANEYLATTINLKQYADLIAFADAFLASDHDQPAAGRASVIAAKVVAQIGIGDKAGATTSIAQVKQLDPANASLPDLEALVQGMQ